MIEKLRSQIGAAEILATSGLGMVGVGVWMWKPHVSLITVGAILLILGVIGRK